MTDRKKDRRIDVEHYMGGDLDFQVKQAAVQHAIQLVSMDEQTSKKKPSTVADDVDEIARKLYFFYYWDGDRPTNT